LAEGASLDAGSGVGAAGSDFRDRRGFGAEGGVLSALVLGVLAARGVELDFVP
jgi:hypothetical protein